MNSMIVQRWEEIVERWVAFVLEVHHNPQKKSIKNHPKYEEISIADTTFFLGVAFLLDGASQMLNGYSDNVRPPISQVLGAITKYLLAKPCYTPMCVVVAFLAKLSYKFPPPVCFRLPSVVFIGWKP